MHDAELVTVAAQSAHNAYCPYSHYPVGAALLAADGRVFRGCNLENASYGLTICAERNALAAAIAHGCRTFTALAIVARTPPAPCGACRQALAEFVPPTFRIVLAAIDQPACRTCFTMAELLPHAFSQHDLQGTTQHEKPET